MVEAAAEANEELMDAYLESGELSVEQIKEGLRIRSLANELIVGLCVVGIVVPFHSKNMLWRQK